MADHSKAKSIIVYILFAFLVFLMFVATAFFVYRAQNFDDYYEARAEINRDKQ